MKTRQLLSLAALVCSARSLASQHPATGATSIEGDSNLNALVAEALERNPSIAQRQAAVRAAPLRIRTAGTLPDPMLTVGVMDLLMPHFEFNHSDFTEADVEVSQEIVLRPMLGGIDGAGEFLIQPREDGLIGLVHSASILHNPAGARCAEVTRAGRRSTVTGAQREASCRARAGRGGTTPDS